MPVKMPKILVVDDMEDWRVTIQGILEDAHYEVVVASSVSEAFQKLEQNDFSLAMLDMRLDETDEDNRDGLHILATNIKDKYPHIKTIILTGYADQESVRAMEPDDGGKSLVAIHMEKTETNR